MQSSSVYNVLANYKLSQEGEKPKDKHQYTFQGYIKMISVLEKNLRWTQ